MKQLVKLFLVPNPGLALMLTTVSVNIIAPLYFLKIVKGASKLMEEGQNGLRQLGKGFNHNKQFSN